MFHTGRPIGTTAALAGSILYVVHHILVITCLFFVAGLLLQLRRTTDLGRLGSLYRDHPGTAVLAMIPLSRSDFYGPMAVAIMGGLIVGTALTLVFLPALYAAWFRVRENEPVLPIEDES